MWQTLVDWAVANKDILAVLVVSEIIAANPKWASGSIGQLIINLIRGAIGAAPVSIPAPSKAP